MKDVNCAAAAAAYIATLSGVWEGVAAWLNWSRVSMGVVDRISSDRSLMLGRHFLMTAKSAAEILVPEPGCAVLLECWTGAVVQPPQEPGFGMVSGACGGQGGEKCWYGWATGAAGCACEKVRGWFCRIAWVWMGCVCTAVVCCGNCGCRRYGCP